MGNRVESGRSASRRSERWPGGQRGGLYRGWWVLLGAFIVHLAASGAVHSSFGLFVVPASRELNISRADANTFLIVMAIGSATIAPFVGRLLDKVSVRLIMALGGVVMATSLVALSSAHSTAIILLIALVPLAFASDSAGGLSAFTVTVRWFRRRRGRAVAITAMAISAGGMIVPPIAGHLIALYGWRSAVAAIGIGAGAVIVATALTLVRVRPSDEELRIAGEVDPASSVEAHRLEKHMWTYRELLTNRNFLFLVFGAGLLVASDRAVLVSVGPYLADAGYGVEAAGFVLSVLGASALGGMMLVGYLSERIDPRHIFAMIVALHIALLLLFMAQPSYPVLLAGVAVVGLGIGGVLPAKQVLMACSFGSGSYGTVLGTGSIILQVLMMIALRFIGEVHDRTGSYTFAFEVFIVLAVISGILIWQVRLLRPTRTAPPLPAD